jgi:hypothetical protein
MRRLTRGLIRKLTRSARIAAKVMALFALLCLCASTARAQTFKRAGATNVPSNNAAPTISLSGVAAGDQIVVLGFMGQTSTSVTCSDGGGSTWSTAIVGSPGTSVRPFECHTFNELGSGSVTITLTLGASTFGIYLAQEWSGITAVDVAAQSNETASSSTSFSYPQLTTTASGDVILCAAANGGVNNTYTAGTGYTIPATNGQISGGGQSAGGEYQIAGAAGAYTPAGTLATAQFTMMVDVAFKASGGSGVQPPPTQMMMGCCVAAYRADDRRKPA